MCLWTSIISVLTLSDISGQKSAALLIAPSTGLAVDTDCSLKGMGLVGPLNKSGAGSLAPGPPLIGQWTINLNRESMYQTSSRRDYLTAQGQSSFYSTGQYGGGNFYTDTTFLKQSQASSTLSALHTWKTNGLYLGKVNHSQSNMCFLLLWFLLWYSD